MGWFKRMFDAAGRTSSITGKRYAVRIIPRPGGPADGEAESLWAEESGTWTTNSVEEANQKQRHLQSQWGDECNYKVITV